MQKKREMKRKESKQDNDYRLKVEKSTMALRARDLYIPCPLRCSYSCHIPSITYTYTLSLYTFVRSYTRIQCANVVHNTEGRRGDGVKRLLANILCKTRLHTFNTDTRTRQYWRLETGTPLSPNTNTPRLETVIHPLPICRLHPAPPA